MGEPYLQNWTQEHYLLEKGQGKNDFTISLNSTNETFSVNETPITTPTTSGPEAENLQDCRC